MNFLRSFLIGFVSLGLIAETPWVSACRAEEPTGGNADSAENADSWSIDEWIGALADDSYLRRQRAIRELRRAGSSAVPRLVTAMDRGDLETTEQVIKLLQAVAIDQPFLPPPDADEQPSPDEPDAWAELKKLASTGGGRGARASTAMLEVRRVRRDASLQALVEAGVFVGITEFVMRSTSTQKRIVQIDDEFTGTHATLSLLQWIDSIGYARVKGSAIRAETIQAVLSMPDLQTLQLLQGSVDEDVLKAIDQSTGVRHLEFRYVDLTGDMIDTIAKLPIRVSLTLNGTGAPVERVEALKEALPGLLVDFKQGGFLGVRCTDSFNACRINDVVPQSGAEEAGLISGDVITAVDETPITRFAELQDEINEHMPGDTIKIRYLRDGEESTATAKLGQLVER